MRKFKRRRHIAKAITWRAVGTLDTMMLGWMISGNPMVGVKVGGFELMTKIILYYLHERAWYVLFRVEKIKSTGRHILKSISWRMVGTLDTTILGFIITGNLNFGLKVGGLELLTKSVLYFLHERVWYRSDFGLIKA